MPSKPPARSDSADSNARLAVLIDADNAQASVIEGLLVEIARFGEATVKRIYGDFTSAQSAAWKQVLQKFAIKPVQQFAYTKGKNATDSTLIIDAMDLLYTRKFDGFCLVTSDSDYTGLATRLREEGLQVYGFGERKTPDAFRNACHKFIFTEVLRAVADGGTPAPKSADPAGTTGPSSAATPKPAAAVTSKAEYPTEFMMDALEESAEDSGWMTLGAFGHHLNKLRPDFDSRLYGFKQLSAMVKARPDLFVTEERPTSSGGHKVLYVRAK
jgi:NYN domain-containing protein/OST-HTH/LOTUS domain-containing protein